MKKKLNIKHKSGRKERVKIRYLIMAGVMASLGIVLPPGETRAESCPDVRIVFARGSGGERWTDQNYLAFKDSIESKLATTEISYEFIDLDYPAIGVGIDNLDVTLGAFFGSGDAYEFGESVDTGVANLKRLINSGSCKATKYVIGGYSQGAMVVSKSLAGLKADKIIYAATFGDPKLYLPEGEGLMPAACRGDNLSDYRMYVPDCQAYKGLLGAYIPYEPADLIGKVGTWCNKRDIFCSSHLSIDDHTSYVADDLYEDASKVIFDKITKAFDVENTFSSPHDTAILIDSTSSMSGLIGKYKEEAYRLAKETLAEGGRVALYDYRDLKDGYEANERCNFETCTLEKFVEELDAIKTHGGGDEPESLLSSSFKVMKELNWKTGATKSLIVLTDASYLTPDRDGTTFEDVVDLSKKIDPVNFYIITKEALAETYQMLAEETEGMVVTNLGELSLLTDYILGRYDALPKVEEGEAEELPEITVTDFTWIDAETARVKFANTGKRALVALNDAVLGVTEENEITLSGLRAGENILTLVPLGDDVRGEAVEVTLRVVMPKAPNTGRAS